MQIVLPGEVKAVTTEVRAESFLDHIAQCRHQLTLSTAMSLQRN
jgi:hypothetical protein